MRTWKPDTCECHIEEIYDGNEIIGGGQVLNKCSAHTNVADEDLYGVLYANPDGENKRKNKIDRLLKGLDGTDFNLHEIDAEGNYVFKNGITLNWQFTGSDENRVLQIDVDGYTLSQAQKNQATAFCEQQFGVNKVEFI